MADSKTATQGVVLILLLMGGEVAAVREKVSVAASVAALDSHGESQDLQAVGPTTWLTGGSDVCRSVDMANATHAVERYLDKMESEECSMGCMMKWNEMTKRMKRFESCAEAVGDSGAFKVGAPSALLEVMQYGPDSLQEGLLAPVEAVKKAMIRNKFFPTFDDIPDCTFVPVGIDPRTIANAKDAESARDLFRKELFGEQCDEASSKLYVQRLNGKQRRMAQETLFQMETMIELIELREDVDGTGNESASENSKAKLLAQELVEEAVNTASEKLLIAEEEVDAQSLLEVPGEADVRYGFMGLMVFLLIMLILGAFIYAILVGGWWVVAGLGVAVLVKALRDRKKDQAGSIKKVHHQRKDSPWNRLGIQDVSWGS